ncbi:GHKL domain-containing protein [Lactobacillus johnsonii]|nr:GHKL domain-containing protein [Lactobacillus johnsonii]MBF0772282.1 GHKL domain-containing protein [Lactobacillus johnsonii]MCI9452103.1 GHKL domain-containing protein [Lactobacillus johnsonii]NDO44049.1 GHKL domain-containing protein [Lactobacillus johnsonii]QMT68598.1 GHKL domain-containing protein [Lactobacillus johnsonii]TFU78829.1 GHKL domain-containing protein [Lactobacillus johnsonii]
MLLVYSFLMLISGVTDLWIFFRVSQIAASKKNILILGGVLLLLPIVCVGIVQLATFLEILFFIFYFRKSKEKDVAVGSILIVGVVDSIIDILNSILMELLHIEDIIYLDLLVQISIIILAVFIIETLYKFLYSYLMSENHNVFIGLLIYLYVSTTLTMIFYAQTKKVTSLSIFFTIFVLIQIVFAIATYVELINIQKHLLKKSQQDKLIKEQKQLQEYTRYLEESEDELRAFRHDYRNMFNSLKISAQEGDTKELIQKLDEYTKTNLNAKAFEKYRNVNHIKVKSLKSIIIAKLTEMYGSKIPYNFECRDDITKIPNNINELDLVRIIGISCDNAIEESKALLKQNKKAHIEIMISSNEDGEFEYEIQNKRRDSEISLKQIQQRGYSTKKSHSGMGLANINSIKNKYENMTISYEIPKGYFDFYLVIEPEELINS